MKKNNNVIISSISIMFGLILLTLSILVSNIILAVLISIIGLVIIKVKNKSLHQNKRVDALS